MTETDLTKKALDGASLAASALPYVGGPISNILSGIGNRRRINRIHGIIDQLALELQDFKSEVAEKYVQTDEFEELLEKILQQASNERNERKRQFYSQFLLNDIKSPGQSYDEKIRYLRTLEELQPDHLKVIQAIAMKPSSIEGSLLTSSPSQTLKIRLPNMDEEHIKNMVAELNDMRLTRLDNLNVMMTPTGASDLSSSITDYGRRFLSYLKDS